MLQLPENAPPQLLAIAPGPGILLAHEWKNLAIHAYTINGRHLATAECKERLSAFAVSADGRFLLTGGVKGIITLYWISSLQVCMMLWADLSMQRSLVLLSITVNFHFKIAARLAGASSAIQGLCSPLTSIMQHYPQARQVRACLCVYGHVCAYVCVSTPQAAPSQFSCLCRLSIAMMKVMVPLLRLQLHQRIAFWQVATMDACWSLHPVRQQYTPSSTWGLHQLVARHEELDAHAW